MTAIARTLAGALTVLLASLLALEGRGPALARGRSRPEPCPAARYLVAGDPIRSPVMGAVGSGIEIGPRVALDELCAGIAPKRRRANANGVTRLVVKWRSCDGFAGPVALRGRVTSGCARFQGTLRARKLRTRKIDATRSDCGDGFVDVAGGEACDDGNGVSGDGCEPTCLPTPSGGTTIRPPTTPTSTTTTTTAPPPRATLALGLVANPSPVLPLGQLTYDVTVTNLGPADGEQVELRLPIPVGVSSCQSISDGGETPDSCFVGRDIVWTLGRLPAGTGRTVQAVVGIGNQGDGTAIVTTARATVAGSPEATAQIASVVAAEAPLMLGLVESRDPVRVGETLEYAVRFGNRGATARLDSTLALTLPPGVTLVDDGGATGGPAGPLVWNVGTLGAGETGERRVRVAVVGLGSTDPLVRAARAVLAGGGVEAQADVVTQVESAAPLGLTMVAHADPVGPSSVIIYELTVTNRAAVAASQVEVRMPIPVGVSSCEAISDAGTTPNSCFTGRDVAWTLPALPARTSRTVQVAYGVGGGAGVPTGTILNATARVTDATGANARAAASTFVADTAAAPLMLGLAEGVDPVRVGETLEYAVRFGNRGAAPYLGMTLALTLPAGVTPVDTGGATEDPAGTLVWNLGTLAAGETGERRVRVAVTALGAGDPLVRAARAVLIGGGFEARASVVTEVEPATLGLAMVAHADPVGPSTAVAYELTATNRGGVATSELQVRMPVPLGVSGCQAISDDGAAPNSCFAGRDVAWTLPPLPAQTSRTVQVVFAMGNLPAGTILHGTGRIADAAGMNASARVSTAVQPPGAAPLMLGVTDSADPVRANDELDYVLRFGNRGASAQLDTTLALTLPPGVAVVDAGGATASPPETLTWNLGTLDAGETGERRARVTVTGLGAADPLVRVARAVLAGGAAEARTGVVTQVEVSPPLGLVMVAQADPVAPSQVVTYELTVWNRGSAPTDQTDLRLSIPVGVANCQAISDGGTTPNACIVGRDVAWALGTLPPGSSRAVRAVFGIPSAVEAPSGTVLSATASVRDGAGTDASAGGGTAVVEPEGGPLMLGLSAGPDPVPVGAELRYTMRFGNRGAGSLAGSQLTMALPAGFTVTDAGGGTPGPGGTLAWALGTLGAGEAGERVVRGTVTARSAGDPPVRMARAVVSSGDRAARAGVVTQVAPTAPLRLSVVAQQDPAAPGSFLTYALTLENAGPSQAAQVELRMGVPVGFGGCVDLGGGSTPNTCLIGRDIVWALGGIAPGASTTVEAKLLVASGSAAPPGTVLFAAARAQDAAGSRVRASVSSTVAAN